MLQKSAVSNYLSCCLEIMISLQFSHLLKAHTFVHYIVQTLYNMKCGFCALKIENSPKNSVIFKIHKNCRCSDLTFWLRLDFIIKIHIALAPKLQILEDIREKDGRRIIS